MVFLCSVQLLFSFTPQDDKKFKKKAIKHVKELVADRTSHDSRRKREQKATPNDESEVTRLK